METPKRYRSWFVGLTLGVLAALLLWPATGRLIIQQAAMTLHVAPNILSYPDNAAAQKIAARHPDDFALQLAEALNLPPSIEDKPITEKTPDSVRKRIRLQALARRFPENPAVYANLLRFMTQGEVMPRREEGDQMADNPPRKAHYTPSPKWGTPEQLAVFDDAAAQGERLDPDNAYFPFMRSIGLYAGHRDVEAEEAVRRAAEKSRWVEYYDAEIDGEWRLQEENSGGSNTIMRIATSASILFPQYASLRSVARMTAYEAMTAEQAGRIEEGLALRQALMECGSKMRVQSRTIIGSLVGIAITKIALARPDGAPPLKFAENSPGHADMKERDEKLLADYAAYLKRTGHPDALPAAQAELAAGRQVLDIGKHINETSPFDKPLQHLIVSWLWSLITLSSAFVMLLLGGSAALLSRSYRIKTGLPLPGYMQWGCFLGLITATVELLLGNLYGPEVCLPVGLLLGPVALFCLHRTWGDRLRSLGMFALTFLAGVLIAAGAVSHIRSMIDPQSGIGSLLNLISMTAPENNPTPDLFPLTIKVICGGILLVPLLTIVTLGIASLRCSVPLTVGLVRGLRGCALPIACFLLLGYAGLTIVTLRQDQAVDYGMQRIMQHEGVYMAELQGKKWPGKNGE